MRIFIIGRASIGVGGNAVGGVSKHIEDLCSALIAQENEVSVWDFSLRKSFQNKGIRVIGLHWYQIVRNLFLSWLNYRIWLNREISLRGKFIVAMQLFSLRKALKADTYDIIHVHSLNRPIISFLDEFNIPIVVTDHGFWHQRHSSSLSKQVRFDKKIRTHVGIARRVISVSAYAQSRLRPFIGEESKSVLIPNPITFKKDYSLEAGKFKQKEKKYIFFNGFTESVKIKGLKDLLEALVVLKEDVKLIVIANEEGQKLCELYAGKVDLKVYSAQPFSKVQEFYAVSNVFVLPSKSESFGLVYLEALSFGVPVIGFEPTCSEFAKVLQCDIGDTYTSNKDTIEDLAAKIKSVLSREFDNEMIRQRVSDNYGWDKGVHKFISCYKSVLENEANN